MSFNVMTALFRSFADARNWFSIVMHVLFAAVFGWIYKTRQRTVAASASVEPSERDRLATD